MTYGPSIRQKIFNLMEKYPEMTAKAMAEIVGCKVDYAYSLRVEFRRGPSPSRLRDNRPAAVNHFRAVNVKNIVSAWYQDEHGIPTRQVMGVEV